MKLSKLIEELKVVQGITDLDPEVSIYYKSDNFDFEIIWSDESNVVYLMEK